MIKMKLKGDRRYRKHETQRYAELFTLQTTPRFLALWPGVGVVIGVPSWDAVESSSLLLSNYTWRLHGD